MAALNLETEWSIEGIGKITRWMARECFITPPQSLLMREIGRKTCLMDWELCITTILLSY